MNQIKQFFFGCMVVGLMTACSSEEELGQTNVPDNREWNSINFSLGVEQGTQAKTRTIGDLDEWGLPKASYPQGLGIYMHKYDYNDKIETSEIITLNEEGSNNNREAKFFYAIDEDRTKITLARYEGVTQSEAFEVSIGEYNTKDGDKTLPSKNCDMFFFASQKNIRDVPFPMAEENWYPKDYPDARDEFGDKLFCTDGYFFQWKDKEHTKLALYLLVRNANKATEIEEVKEIVDWNTKKLDLTMKRLTACISIRMVLIDHFDPKTGNIVSLDVTEKNALEKTNEAVREYVKAKHPDLEKDFANFNAENIFIRKKMFREYPSTYDWATGPSMMDRTDLYLCSLDYPSWVGAYTTYEHGKIDVKGLTATCDNEPFIPVDGQFIPGVQLLLFMGIGQRDPSAPNNQGGYYDRVVRYLIPFGEETTASNSFHATPNTRTYIYVGLTLENIVELYKKLQEEPEEAQYSSRFASVSEIVLSSNQLIMTSEPYTGQHTH